MQQGGADGITSAGSLSFAIPQTTFQPPFLQAIKMEVKIDRYYVRKWNFSFGPLSASYRLGGLQPSDPEAAYVPAFGSPEVELSETAMPERTPSPASSDDDIQEAEVADFRVPLVEDDYGAIRVHRDRDNPIYVDRSGPAVLVRGLAQVHGRLSHEDDTPLSILAFELFLAVPKRARERSLQFSLQVRARELEESDTENSKDLDPVVIEFSPQVRVEAREERSELRTKKLWTDSQVRTHPDVCGGGIVYVRILPPKRLNRGHTESRSRSEI
jgi:hypothetical protein